MKLKFHTFAARLMATRDMNYERDGPGEEGIPFKLRNHGTSQSGSRQDESFEGDPFLGIDLLEVARCDV